MRREVVYALVLATVGLGCLVYVGEAGAQMAEDNQMLGPLDLFEGRMTQVRQNIAGVLTGTFWTLATIEFTFAMVMVALHEGGMEGFVREIVLRILFIGFFWTLLLNGADWMDAIVGTFTRLGSVASGSLGPGDLTPDGILDVAVRLIIDASTNLSVFNLKDSIALLFAAGIVFIALLLIAANLALVLLELYIVGYGGIVLLALGGSRWTKDYAIKYLQFSFAIGMRLFIFFLIAGIGVAEITDRITGDFDPDRIEQWWALAGFSVVLCFVAGKAPDAINGLLNGVSTQAAVNVATAARTIGTTAAAASSVGASAIGSASAGFAAARLGSQQAGSTSLNTVANLTKSGIAEAKAGLSGTSTSQSAFPGKGTVGGRMAASMDEQRTAGSSTPSGESTPPAASASTGGAGTGSSDSNTRNS